MLTLSGNQCQCYEDSELFHGPLVVRGGAAVYTGGGSFVDALWSVRVRGA